MAKTDKIILGLDPGTLIMGVAVLQIQGQQMSLLHLDVIKLNHLTEQAEKLKVIYQRCAELMARFNPNEVAAEAPFFGKNVQSMLKLGRAQGVALAAALAHNIPIFEYSPRKIKQSVTGRGNASKEQVALTLAHWLKTDVAHRYTDATDALAAAVCHHLQGNKLIERAVEKLDAKTKAKVKKGSGNWAQFLAQNPERIIP